MDGEGSKTLGTDSSSPHWKRNLVFIWGSQFLSIMGFSFGIPFAPFYIQYLGVRDADELNMYVALFGAATPLTMAIFSPIWGALSDRVGRRPMLLRAYFGAAVVLSLMGVVGSPFWLIVLRLLQGVLTGTVTASQTLVSAHTPERHTGMALGSLSSAMFSGALVGAGLGGWTADVFGYRTAFCLSGLLMLGSAALVLFGVRESFSAPPRKEGEGGGQGLFSSLKPGPEQMRLAMPILTLLAGVMFVKQFDTSYLPLLVQNIHGMLKGASILTGNLYSVCGVAGVLAGFILGWLADRVSPAKIGKWSAFAAGLLMIPQAFALGMPMLFCARFGMVFAAGGLEPLLQIWLSKTTPQSCRGLIFGWSASARSLGWFMAPLCGGVVASSLGIHWVFLCSCFLYMLLIPAIAMTVRRLKLNEATQSDGDDVNGRMVSERL